jgi:hypothetical protein
MYIDVRLFQRDNQHFARAGHEDGNFLVDCEPSGDSAGVFWRPELKGRKVPQSGPSRPLAITLLFACRSSHPPSDVLAQTGHGITNRPADLHVSGTRPR